jgi:hypothetical protein
MVDPEISSNFGRQGYGLELVENPQMAYVIPANGRIQKILFVFYVIR